MNLLRLEISNQVIDIFTMYSVVIPFTYSINTWALCYGEKSDDRW
jgi:hypothetical protein